MNKIELYNLDLKTFTEQDVLDYCQINSINPYNIKELNLINNELTDISGIRLFKNLKYLYLNNNKIKDISVTQYLKNLQSLNIDNNKIKDISVLKYLKELSYLYISDTEIKDISVIKNLNNLNILGIENLELESDQIQYIQLLNNLQTLWSLGSFKDISVLKQLNKDIRIIK